MNENETKELSFGENNSSAPVSSSEDKTTPTPTVKPEGGNNGGNSFYDRQQNNNNGSIAWYKDWRGKTLGLTLAGLILIGGGIPLGMFATGYWRDGGSANLVDQTELSNAFDLTNDEVERVFDKAVRQHYDNMVYEGYITKSTHKNKIKEAKESAEDTIDSAKESLKKKYGTTWKEEWDKSLKDKGFHTSSNGGETEYKDSMISDSIIADVKTEYNSKTSVTSTIKDGEDGFDNMDFKSTEANSRGKWYYIENKAPIVQDDPNVSSWDDIKNDDGEKVTYSYTEEDLVNLFLLTYQPILFNNSLLSFTPVEGANDTTSNIQGNNVYMTNDNVKSAWSFAKASSSGVSAAQNFGGIQKKYDLSFSGQSLGEEADIATNLFLNNKGINPVSISIEEIVNAGFANAGLGSFDTITSTDINNMNSQDVQAFSEGVAEILKTNNLLTSKDSRRNFASTGLYGDRVSFVSTNGLNNIGVEFEGSEIITEQLDYFAGTSEAIDISFISTFSTWFESAFKYITIIDYLTDPSDYSKGWFDFDKGTKEITSNLVLNDKFEKEIGSVIDDSDIESITGNPDATKEEATQVIKDYFKFVFFKDIATSAKTDIVTTYQEGQDFVKENWEDYNAEDWSTVEGKDLVDFLSQSNLNLFSDEYFREILDLATSSSKEKNLVLPKGGVQ